MLNEINGLPAHVLLIHLIVVLAPLGALFTVLSAFWPAARRKLGFMSPLACLIVLVLTPITTNAGEWLEDRITQGQDENSAFVRKIEKHADLGDTFLFLAIGLFVFSAAVWIIGRRNDRAAEIRTDDTPAGSGGTATAVRTSTATAVPAVVTYGVAVLATIVSVITVIQLVRIGDSGASAVWGR